MLTVANANFVGRHYSSVALGPVNSNLEDLSQRTQDVVQNWGRVQSRGFELVPYVENVKRVWNITVFADFGSLQNAIGQVRVALGGSHSDVTRLRNETHAVAEATRSRSMTLQSHADSIQLSIWSKEQTQRDVQQTIENLNAEIDAKERDAREIESRAKSETDKADSLSRRGLFLAVLGGLAAPSTFGITWLITAFGISDIASSGKGHDRARELRQSAANLRNQILTLQSEARDCDTELSRLKNELDTKKQELSTVRDCQRTVESVKDALNTYGSLLNPVIQKILDIEGQLGGLSYSADCMEIAQCSLNSDIWDSIEPTATRTYNDFLGHWQQVHNFLFNTGRPTNSLHGVTPGTMYTPGLQLQPQYQPGISTQTQFPAQGYNNIITPGFQPHYQPGMSTQTQFPAQGYNNNIITPGFQPHYQRVMSTQTLFPAQGFNINQSTPSGFQTQHPPCL